MPLVVTDGLIVPGICGPFGVLLPIRLRAKVVCAVKNGKANLEDIGKVTGRQETTLAQAVQSMTPMDAGKVIRAFPG